MKRFTKYKMSAEALGKVVGGEEISGGGETSVQDGICPKCKKHPRFKAIRFDDGVATFYYMCVHCGVL